MASALVMVTVHDPAWLRILEHHVRREVAKGRTPIVIDTVAVGGSAVESYDHRVLTLARLETPGHDIRARVEALGGVYHPLSDFLGEDSTAPLSPQLEESNAIAAQSAVITFFRTDRPNPRKRTVRRTRDALLNEGRATYRGIAAALVALAPVDVVYIPNGRFPGQRLAAIAAREAGVSAIHFEKGETPNGTYLQPHAPQDRLATQGAVEPILSNLSTDEIDAIADEWLARRAPAKYSSNEFSSLWSADISPDLAALGSGGSKVAGFFTSSQDEFQFLGPEWQLHDWEDQFEAFDRMLTEFEKQDYVCYLRVHPNLATKAHECFVRERDGVRMLAARHPALKVIWHDDTANTYGLMGLSDAIVVWDSTVGLEASARGIPVWTMATSRYGITADITELLSASDLEKRGVTAWTVDPHRAKRFIAYLVLRDEQMEVDPDAWLPWSSARPPFATRIAAALVSGGAPTAAEALASVLDVYRHRSARSNLLHLRGR